MNEVGYYLFLIKMAAVWHFAHAAACLIVILGIAIIALRIHIADTNALGPGSRRIVDMIVKAETAKKRIPGVIDKRRDFAVYLLETIKRRLAWKRKR